jgi:hypothetical protein
MSALLVEDCEAYKAFLSPPSPAFVGPKTPRNSPRWRPFAPDALTPESLRYATSTLSAARGVTELSTATAIALGYLIALRFPLPFPTRWFSDPLTPLRRVTPSRQDNSREGARGFQCARFLSNSVYRFSMAVSPDIGVYVAEPHGHHGQTSFVRGIVRVAVKLQKKPSCRSALYLYVDGISFESYEPVQ